LWEIIALFTLFLRRTAFVFAQMGLQAESVNNAVDFHTSVYLKIISSKIFFSTHPGQAQLAKKNNSFEMI